MALSHGPRPWDRSFGPKSYCLKDCREAGKQKLAQVVGGTTDVTTRMVNLRGVSGTLTSLPISVHLLVILIG